MGYYTKYSFEVIEGDDHKTDYEKEIQEISEYGSSLFEQSVKWYDCDKDMLQLSKKYRSVLFCITGEGEESFDLWKAYYKNGKMQKVSGVVTYDEFDETKLK